MKTPRSGDEGGRERPESLAALRQRAAAGRISSVELGRLAQDDRAGVQALVRQLRRQRDRQAAERRRLRAMLVHERPLWAAGATRVAGVDEVGAGPLAGPVVAAAVILPKGASIDGINDSKLLSERERQALAVEIRARAVAFCVAHCSVAEIDRLNIYQAAREAMRRAVAGLSVAPQHLLVDARTVPGIALPQSALIKGDRCSQSIAAASIIAKVARDALMDRLARLHPGYGFEQHKGYGTAQHLDALRALGPCPIHRRTFGPVAALLAMQGVDPAQAATAAQELS